MNFDDAPPVAAADYRRFQRIVPGIEGLYEVLLALCEQRLADNEPVLISGVGGGRELAALAGSSRQFRITGVDPSRSMLDVARDHLAHEANDRVVLTQGVVDDLPIEQSFAAATSILIMHFLPDDGSKLDYLRAIRTRLRPGASYFHSDVSITGPSELHSLGPAITYRGQALGLPQNVWSIPEVFGQNGLASDPTMIVDPSRVEALLGEAGFRVLAMPHRCMWFTSWLAEAA